AMTILWFSEANAPGQLSYKAHGALLKQKKVSRPEQADALKYSTWEDTTFFEAGAPSTPYRHRIRIDQLLPATTYSYTVTQGASSFSSSFQTAPDGNETVRFIIYGDSETEPESTGKYAIWTDPKSKAPRKYLIDQTLGYHNNLEVIRSREPDLVLIAGDLVQHGGEQRDWDEFWRHNTDPSGTTSLAGRIPIMAALGNHEYYAGTTLGRYDQPGSERAISKYLSYFEYPSNQAPPEDVQDGRYYSLEYGPATLIVVDLCNNSPNGSNEDTNFVLKGENEASGGNAPDFGPHSRQYRWLEYQLMIAQRNSLFTFVVFHHAPYSSGPHGLPPGDDDQSDKQSGQAARLLTPLFMRYGVDAVFNGHDELWERSLLSGTEVYPDGRKSEHSIQFYDVGVGGDGLRAPIQGLENPYQQFLVHTDAPEEWQNGVLIDGGKHYGHLEVDITEVDTNTWQAVLKPIYVFPVMESDGKTFSSYSRRMYDDQITLTRFIK
ncbi:MAG: metallophosphoesterase family protein, partial [Candidatus Marinimicrobia bacterium]|nr:metallophosphoesterase family protein [Candidatus Neomarinimicrobiota bacterium]